MACNIQKPLSSMTSCPVWKIGLPSLNSMLVVLPPKLSNSGAGFSRGESFPSTSSTCHMMPEEQQQIEWYSLPKGQGFLGTNMNPGQVYLFVQGDMDTSRLLHHPGPEILMMLLFQATIISRTSQIHPCIWEDLMNFILNYQR